MGEPKGYTAERISDALRGIPLPGVDRSKQLIWRYAKKNNLYITIRTMRGHKSLIVPESNLERLVNLMKIPVDSDRLAQVLRENWDNSKEEY